MNNRLSDDERKDIDLIYLSMGFRRCTNDHGPHFQCAGWNPPTSSDTNGASALNCRPLHDPVDGTVEGDHLYMEILRWAHRVGFQFEVRTLPRDSAVVAACFRVAWPHIRFFDGLTEPRARLKALANAIRESGREP